MHEIPCAVRVPSLCPLELCAATPQCTAIPDSVTLHLYLTPFPVQLHHVCAADPEGRGAVVHVTASQHQRNLGTHWLYQTREECLLN